MMKTKRFAVFFAAAFTLLAALPLLRPAAKVCAAESETEEALPDWVPADYDSALKYRSQNVLIHGDLLCIVSTEYGEEDSYSFSFQQDKLESVSSAHYTNDNQVNFRVDVLKAIAPGSAEVYHMDCAIDQRSKLYAFSIDEDLNITGIGLPNWFPTYFDSALSFYNRYGKTFVSGGQLCTVFHETYPAELSGRVEDCYALAYSEDTLSCLFTKRFSKGNNWFSVSLFAPTAPGEAKITHKEITQDVSPYEYTFSIDHDLNIRETDLCAWVPDCYQEFNARLRNGSAVLTHGGDIAFLLETTGGTGYAWKEAVNDPALAGLTASIDCSPLQIYSDEARPSGGQNLEARVYRTKKDGQLELRLDLMPPGRDAEPADSLGGIMQITDQAGMVLLPGEARIMLLNADTGQPVVFPFDQDGSFYIDYLIGEESLDPENFNPTKYAEIKAAVTKLPLGSMFAAEEYSLWMNPDSLPQGYYFDAVYANGACDSGDAIEVTRYTDDIADITIKVQFAAEGDINHDGAFSIADVVMLQRWLLGTLEAAPKKWKAGDFINDDRLDARDLTVMKRRLLDRAAAIEENGLRFILHTSYSGYGVMGQDLGSGSFDKEYYVIEGDAFYETYGGHWFQNVRLSNSLLLKIEKIEADTVTVSVIGARDGSREKKILNIGETADDVVFSDHIVFDGTNYYYTLCFEHITSAADAG